MAGIKNAGIYVRNHIAGGNSQAIEEGIDAQVILQDGLLSGMSVIGDKFKNNEVFVPEVLVAAELLM